MTVEIKQSSRVKGAGANGMASKVAQYACISAFSGLNIGTLSITLRYDEALADAEATVESPEDESDESVPSSLTTER